MNRYQETVGNALGFTALMKQYKSGAEERGLVFRLTEEEFLEVTGLPCWYCGCEPRKEARKGVTGSYVYNGVDRVDNRDGYVYENCVPCCGTCNSMKSNRSLEDFLAKVRSIAIHMRLR